MLEVKKILFGTKSNLLKAKVTKNLISNSNIGKEIIKFKEEYCKLYNLFGNMQEKFHSQSHLFIRDTNFE